MKSLSSSAGPALKVEGSAVTNGRARYTTDLLFPGMLIGRLVYTAHAHATVRRLDVSVARALPGVIAVLTADDVPGHNSFKLYDTDQPLLIREGDRARYQGDAVALVAAVDQEAADSAARAIVVDYEVLQGLHDPIAALEPDAPQVWSNRSNLIRAFHAVRGDPAAAIATADVVVENVYWTQCMEQAFLEPEGAVAVPEPDGSMTVYAGCQAPFRDRQQIARSLAIPEAAVRVIVPAVGGSFGGKDETHVQIHAALLAQASGRPVKIIRSREESILTHVKRHPIIVRHRVGATWDGRLVAMQVEAWGDGGPYMNMTPQVMEVFTIHAGGPYWVPASSIDAYAVRTNNPAAGAMRGFGMPQAAWACERQMDALATTLGIDPADLRRKNLIQDGRTLATGVTVQGSDGARASLEAATTMIGWSGREQHRSTSNSSLRRGWGLASVMQGYLLGPRVGDAAHAGVELHDDGGATLRTGVVDYGQGAHTVLCQILGERLGISLDRIRLIGPDTDKTLDAGSACASRVTHTSGHAVIRAAEPLRQGLLRTASELCGRSRDELGLEGDFVTVEGVRTDMTIGSVIQAARLAGRQTAAVGHYSVAYPEGTFDLDVFDNPCGHYSFGTMAVQLVVDLETGAVTIERIALAIDAGTILNTSSALGQAEGGILQGVGYALMEELLIDHGLTRNKSLESYLIPTVLDSPVVEVRFLGRAYPDGPLGARGLAELPIVPVAPAIANAIADATGAACYRLPMTAERVLEAIDWARRP